MIFLPTRRELLSTIPVVLYGYGNNLAQDFWVSKSEANDWPIEQRIGSTHVDPGYHFTEQNILNEGAKKLELLGTEVIKVWFHLEDEKYPHNSNWPSFDTLIERAEHEYFRELFDRPFKTYQLSTFSEPSDVDGHYFRHGMDEDDIENERSQFYDFTEFLLEKYDGTGKEFVLKNWESDWAIRGDFDPEIQPDETALDGMVEWFNARQLGVTQARDDIESDVTVLHAAEVNHPLMEQEEEMDLVTTAVLPDTNVDLVSYSAHELIPRWDEPPNPNNDDGRGEYPPPLFVDFVFETLDFINDHAPNPSPYVQPNLVDPTKNVFVGEYGIPEYVRGSRQQYRFTKVLTEASLDWGSRWSVFWQLYDNEGHGWWLINSEGERLPVYEYFEQIFEDNRTPSRPSYDRLDIEFERLIDDRAFQCFSITLLDQDEVIQSFEIGVPMDEPVIWNGAFWEEETEIGTFRWFGGNEGRTEIYFEEGIFRKSTSITLYGRPREPGIEATVYLNGEKVGERYLDGWDPKEWTFEFDSTDQPTPYQTPTPTPDDPTPTPTPTPTPPPDDPTPKPTPTPDKNGIPGPGIVGTVGSLFGAGYVLKWWSDKRGTEDD